MTAPIAAGLFGACQRRIWINEIQARVARAYCIPEREMTSARRSREVARPRQVAMYLSRNLTPLSLPQIGRAFGGRDHTTVIHAIRQIESLRSANPRLDAEISAIARGLAG